MNQAGKAAARTLEIGEDSAGQRLDNFLHKTLKGAPKTLIYRIIRSGEVRVNKGRAGPDTRLEAADLVRIPPLALAAPENRAAPAGAARAGDAFPVLYEDDGLLAIDKPAGVAAHGGSGISFGVIEALRASRPQAKFLELVHRLDRDTSGVLLLARKRLVLVAMHALLREGRTDKRYLALVRGAWPHAAKHHIRTSLASYVTREGERRVAGTDHEDAKEAHSVVNVARRFADATLLEVQIKTGRTHQIRVHLASEGYPILGDDKYGDFPLNKRIAKAGLARMFLHAARISFLRPETGERIRIEAELPAECQRYLAGLAPAKA
jgi:23S rRNA pseudouridine955/2504/2580 synthase